MTGEICRSNTHHSLQPCYDSKWCFFPGWLQNSLHKIREGRNIINNLQTRKDIQRKQPSWSSLLRHEISYGGKSLSPSIGCLWKHRSCWSRTLICVTVSSYATHVAHGVSAASRYGKTKFCGTRKDGNQPSLKDVCCMGDTEKNLM